MSKVDTVKALYAAFAQGDIPTVLAGMAPDIEWREAEGSPYQPSGAPWIGADGWALPRVRCYGIVAPLEARGAQG